MSNDATDDRSEALRLFEKLKDALPELQRLLDECSSHWVYEDLVYRFYHQSFKVFRVQDTTTGIVEALQALAPDRALNARFMEIVEEGTGTTFQLEHNEVWAETTRPMLEAFFHARYFLEMAVKYGSELETPPTSLPSGWATFLYLYDLR